MENPIKDRLTAIITTTNFKAWFYGLVLLFAVIALMTFKDYGMIWDEEWQYLYGEHVIAWYRTLFRDASATGYLNLYYYGGLFDVVANLFTRILPFGVYETRHLVNAAFGLLGVFAVWKLGVLVAGRAVGLAAALLLLLVPAYYGHAFNNPKDVPFAALATLALYFILRAAREVPRVPAALCVKTGLALGAALAVRVGGAFLVGYLVLFWAVRLPWRPAAPGGWWRPALTCLGRIGLVVLVAWPTMLLCWPWAQQSPLLRPVEAFLAAADFRWSGAMLFRGEIISSLDLPWNYLPAWLLVTLPEALFVGVLAGLFTAARALLRREPVDRTAAADLGSLLFAVLFPVLAVIALHSVLYDAYRQFLFVVPPLALLAAWGLVAFLRRRDLGAPWRWAVAGLAAVALLVTAVDMVRLHPYQYVYFNRLLGGGLAGAAQRYETDYWGASYREGIETLVRHYRPAGPGPVKVMITCGMSAQIQYWLLRDVQARHRFVVDQDSGDPDIVLTTSRPYCQDMRGVGRQLFTVDRFDTPLLYVYERRPRGTWTGGGAP